MIAVERRGRLGNQMFQFAFGLSAASQLGTSFVMADDELREWFTLLGRSRFPGRLMRSAEYRIRQRTRRFPGVTVPGDSFERPEDVLADVADDTTYMGYFQSERFFAGVADGVRSAFRPRPEYQQAFHDAYGPLLQSAYVCCHVRRGDYLELRGGVALPASYYRDSLDRLQAKSEVPVVVVGDDLEWAQEELADVAADVRFERNSEAVDLLLLSHAQAVVASNSTFAWWGAWLGDRSDRPIFAPRFWLGVFEGAECPTAVVPERWTQVAVNARDTGDTAVSTAGGVSS